MRMRRLHAAPLARVALLRHVPTLTMRARMLATRTLDTPFISDTVPLAEGVLGKVEEVLCTPGQAVEENEVIAVVETDKVTLDVRASSKGVIAAVLIEVGDEVKERQPIYTLEDESG